MKAITPHTKVETSEFVRPKDVALRYDVTTATVHRWIRQGLFPAVKQGKVVRVRMAEVITAMEGKER
ncbi:MAG: helix-turn-helix domain-containing protein [Luteolibacter sp.]